MPVAGQLQAACLYSRRAELLSSWEEGQDGPQERYHHNQYLRQKPRSRQNCNSQDLSSCFLGLDQEELKHHLISDYICKCDLSEQDTCNKTESDIQAYTKPSALAQVADSIIGDCIIIDCIIIRDKHSNLKYGNSIISSDSELCKLCECDCSCLITKVEEAIAIASAAAADSAAAAASACAAAEEEEEEEDDVVGVTSS